MCNHYNFQINLADINDFCFVAIFVQGNPMIRAVACELAKQISRYCQCVYPCENVEIWTTRCDTNSRDVVLTGRLIPTNVQQGTNLMQAMSQWLGTGRPYITVNNEQVTVDKQCDVAIDYPYATDCTAGNTGSKSDALGGGNDDDDDDDDNSTGAIVGGLIAGLLIICITIVVVVLIFQVFKRKQQK